MNKPARHHARAFFAAALMSGLFSASALAQAPPSAKATNPPTVSAVDIRDIRGPKQPAFAAWIPALATAIAASAAAGYAMWRWSRNRKRRPKGPRETALEQLEEARELMREGNSREFSIAVSSIVRQYIEGSFQLVATHLTTHEFLSGLLRPSNKVLADKRELLSEFLESCDLAKFGGWNLAVASMSSMHDSARRFIVESAEARASGDALPLETDDSYVSLSTT